MPTSVEIFEQLIRHQSPKELVPFLLQVEKKELVALREKLKSLKKELETFVEISPKRWGTKGTSNQYASMYLAGFVVYTRREALSRAFAHRGGLSGYQCAEIGADELKRLFLELMAARRPDWLADWLSWMQRRGGAFDYELLRELETRQFIPHLPLVIVGALSRLLHTWSEELSECSPVPTNAGELMADRLRADAVVVERDLWLFFDFESQVNVVQARVQPIMPPQPDWKPGELYPWQVWNEQHPQQMVKWLELLVALTASGHLERGEVLTRCLLALRRDFERPLLAWFKELFGALKPSMAERLARQHELVELLVQPLPVVVSFAVEQLKSLWAEPGFEPAPVLLYADSLLLRQDVKTALKTLLAGLAKLPLRQPALASVVASLLAAALAHPDTAVQELAAKNLASLLDPKKTLLTAADCPEILAVMEANADLLNPTGRALLAPWLRMAPAASVDGAGASAGEMMAAYAPIEVFVPDISPATAIEPVADWHELLFLTGQALQHNDPAATERWLDGLLRLQGQLPANYVQLLRPYLVQVFPQLKKVADSELVAHLTAPLSTSGHEALGPQLLARWASNFATTRAADAPATPAQPADRTPLLLVEQRRYLLAETLLRNRQALLLLSTPTHGPYWVAPTALLRKLFAYEAAGTEPCAADLALALARTAHTHPTEATEALRLVPQLHHHGLRDLLTWFLAPTLQPLPAPDAQTRRTAPEWPAIPATLAEALPATLAEALPELWAVAARTKAPQAIFATLPDWLGYDYPGAAQPSEPQLGFAPHEHTYKDYSKPGQPDTIYRWVELVWSNAAVGEAPSALLLYAPPDNEAQRRAAGHVTIYDPDFPFLVALLPNGAGALYEYVLRGATYADNLEASERDLVAEALRALLGPGPVFEPAMLFLLACGLMHHTPGCRSLAQEVLLQGIAQGRVVPQRLGQALGQLLANCFAPVQRLADNLAPLRAIDALTDDALRQLFDALLPELPAEPLRNQRKLLDAATDLLARTRHPAPAAWRPRLEAWQATTSLKTVAKALLSMSAG